MFSAFAATYSWGALFNSCKPTADATPTGNAQAAQPESIVKSILSPISESGFQLCKIPTVVESVFGSVPRFANHMGRTFRVGKNLACRNFHGGQQRPEQARSFLARFLTRWLFLLSIWPFVEGRNFLLTWASFTFALGLRFRSSRWAVLGFPAAFFRQSSTACP